MLTTNQHEKNRTAFENMVAYAAAKGSKVAIETNYTLAPPDPVPGRRYFVAECGLCGEVTPFFADTSDGKFTFDEAEFFIRTTCGACGMVTSARPHELRSEVWA